MSLNDTPSSERVHIGIFGRRNAGKSSLINALTGQNLAIVSDIRGTTTDPVSKAMEILPLGPVMITDTPGTDDEGELGSQRVKASYRVLNRTDIALLVTEGTALSDEDKELLSHIKKLEIPYIVVYNKCDAHPDLVLSGENEIKVSAVTGENIKELRELIARQNTGSDGQTPLIRDKLSVGDFAVLVIPIDKAAPKGRLILPEQQTIRDILDAGAVSVTVRDTELEDTLKSVGKKPSVVITDSQAFGKVSKITPPDIMLTSFSILMARHKGTLAKAVKGVRALDTLADGDTVLISEGCTHHRQCGDIGSVKLPAWINKYTGGKKISFEFTSGKGFPDDLSPYKMVIHCGGCMLNEREMLYRSRIAEEQNIPMTNYGIAIAQMNGILKRSVEILPEIHDLLG